MSEPRRGYTAEFKRQAVALSKQPDYGLAKAAQELGIPLETLRSWRYKGNNAVTLTPPSTDSDDPAVLKAQIRELQKQLARSELEKQILTKATAYFAKESQ
jgi:transposase